MFFFWLIVGAVLVIAAIANMILTNLSDIVSVLASFIFLGWTIVQAIREILYAFHEDEFIWLLYAVKYLFFGCFFSYFPYAWGTILFHNAEKANYIGTLIAFIILTVMCIVDCCLMESESEFGAFLVVLAIQIAVMCVPQIYEYNVWTKEKLEAGVDETITYTLDRDSYPIIEEVVKYKNKRSAMCYRFPYFSFNSKYRFVQFKKGETVYSVGSESSYMSVGILKNLKLRKEDCQLVCNADRTIVGYIPTSHFVGYGDEDVLETVKKDAVGNTFTIIKPNGHMSIVNSGDTKISKEIEFLDSSTLRYRQVQYVFTWEGAGPHWEEQEVLEEEVYSYEFTQNKRDEIFLTFDGVRYTVNVDYNDNTISDIVAPKQ